MWFLRGPWNAKEQLLRFPGGGGWSAKWKISRRAGSYCFLPVQFPSLLFIQREHALAGKMKWVTRIFYSFPGCMLGRLHQGTASLKVLPCSDQTRESQLLMLPGTASLLLNGQETLIVAPDTFSLSGWFTSSREKKVENYWVGFRVRWWHTVCIWVLM